MRTPGPGRPGEFLDAARARAEILQRIFGVDPAFERRAAHAMIWSWLQAQRLAVGDAQRFAHEIDAGDRLGDRMLDLDARVHLDEVELAARARRTGIRACPRCDSRAWRASRVAEAHSAWRSARRERRRRRLLEDLLAAPLQRAFALEQMHHVARRRRAPAPRCAVPARMKRSRYTPPSPKAACASRCASGSSASSWAASCATRMPRPPPPAAALIMIG